MFIDARIPVRFLDERDGAPQPDGAGMALILPAGSAAPEASGWVAVRVLPKVVPDSIPKVDPDAVPKVAPDAVPKVAPDAVPAMHPSACACCGGRSEAALMLIALFQARARGEVGFFRSVVASLPINQATALRGMLLGDAFLSGCFVAVG